MSSTRAPTETRTIASIGTPAANSTTLWQPLPDGPVITIPAGSTNVPVTSIAGFVVGEKIALGYGATYPVGRDRNDREIRSRDRDGRSASRARKAVLPRRRPPARARSRFGNVDNISVGDKIRLDIASVGHGIEMGHSHAVGTAGANGTGLTIAEKLKFDHASNMPFSDRGTGISFSPATAFAHSSNEPVQALGSGITLDKPLTNDHAIDAMVRDARVTTAGYQGDSAQPVVRRPAFSANAGSIVLRDAGGLVVDSLNYGGLVDPWAAEGYQGVSGAGQSGCRAPVPSTGRGGGQGAAGGGCQSERGPFPDGADTDSNCTDFLTQIATTMPAASAAGATNIKVGSVADFAAGQTIIVDTGADAETAVIATVGTAGATTVGADAAAGATVITVASVAGFNAGQSITIDSGANAETAVVVSTAAGRGGGGAAGGRGGAPTPATITVAAPLKFAHATGAQVSGTGITLTAPLSRAHAIGAPVATSAPTPGAPNKYLLHPQRPAPDQSWSRFAPERTTPSLRDQQQRD